MRFLPSLPLAAALCAPPAAAQFNFTPSETRLDVGSPGEWNDQHVRNPIVLDTTVFHGAPHTMYYVGHGGPYGHGPERSIVGVARSADGVAWHRHPTALLGWGPPGSWDAAGRIWISVTEHPFPAPDRFRMYYSAADGHDRVATTKTRIGLATSPDGLTFVKHPVPVLDVGDAGAWDDAAVFACCVLSPLETGHPHWQMWYTGYSDRPGVAGATAGIGHATSRDGGVVYPWIRTSVTPIASFSGGGLDGAYFYRPVVRFVEGRYHMWISRVEHVGGPGTIRSVHWYSSPDGLTGWEGPYQPDGVRRFADEAFPQWDGAGDELRLWHVVQDGGGTHPFYGGTYDNIAIATAPIYREHPGGPYLLTGTQWYRTVPLTIAVSDARAPDVPCAVLLDLVFNRPPISVASPFGVFALERPIHVLSGTLDSSGSVRITVGGFNDPNAVGFSVNMQAAIGNLATLHDALTNPMTLYLQP